MVRIARERIDHLFALAEREGLAGDPALADRYASLARRIGMRYNVRLLPEYRELFCRGCSAYWVEGRSVRTRLRGDRRVRTCLRCGRVRRQAVRPSTARRSLELGSGPGLASSRFEGLTGPVDASDAPDHDGDESEDE